MNKADTPEIDDRGGEFYKLGRGKPIAVSTQQNRNKKQLLKLIDEMLPAGDDRQAGRRGDEDRRRRPAEHRQVDLHQHPGPRRADDRLGAARDDPRLGRRPVRARRPAVPGDRHRRASSARPRSATTSTSTRSTAPSGRSAGPTSSCCSSTPPRGSPGSTSRLADYIAKQYKPCIFVVNKWDLMIERRRDDPPRRHGPVRQRRPARLPDDDATCPWRSSRPRRARTSRRC